jgi:hypothetical protein
MNRLLIKDWNTKQVMIRGRWEWREVNEEGKGSNMVEVLSVHV